MQKGGQVVAQMLLTQGWLRCPGSSSHMGIHAKLPLEREKKPNHQTSYNVNPNKNAMLHFMNFTLTTAMI